MNINILKVTVSRKELYKGTGQASSRQVVEQREEDDINLKCYAKEIYQIMKEKYSKEKSTPEGGAA